MTKRDTPILMLDGTEIMMNDAEAKAYYDGLPVDKEGVALVGPAAAKYGVQFVKSIPGLWNNFTKMKGVRNIGKIFNSIAGNTAKRTAANSTQNVKNLGATTDQAINAAAQLNKAKTGAKPVPNMIKTAANKVKLETTGKELARLSRKTAKLKKAEELALKGQRANRIKAAVAGGTGLVAADVGFNRDDANTTVVDNNGTVSAPLAIDSNGTAVATGDMPFPYVMTPGSRPDFSDQVGNLEATPYSDAMEFAGHQVDNARANGASMSDAEIIAGIMSKHNAGAGIGTNIPQEFVQDQSPGAQLAAAIASVNKPEAVTNVKDTISSDPGYTDGYRVDSNNAGARIAQVLNAPSANPFAKNFSPSAWVNGAGNGAVDAGNGIGSYEQPNGTWTQERVPESAATRTARSNPELDKILSLF